MALVFQSVPAGVFEERLSHPELRARRRRRIRQLPRLPRPFGRGCFAKENRPLRGELHFGESQPSLLSCGKKDRRSISSAKGAVERGFRPLSSLEERETKRCLEREGEGLFRTRAWEDDAPRFRGVSGGGLFERGDAESGEAPRRRPGDPFDGKGERSLRGDSLLRQGI